MGNKNYTESDKYYDVALVGSGFAVNYGAILTNYAMYKLIESLNLKPLMVDKPKMLNSVAFNELDYEDTIARRFMKKYMNVSEIYNNNSDLSKLNDICDTFIVDSDQNWRFNNFGDCPYYFFLDWVFESKKKLSYAASFGIDKLEVNETTRNNISYLLKRFDCISVREDSGIKICKEELDVDAVQVLDPIFVADKRIYDDLANKYFANKPSEDYIAAYILDEFIEKSQILNYIQEKSSLKIRKISDAMKEKTNLENYPGIEEFVYTIKNSKYVVTDSYHGVCLSIIFGKPFVCIPNVARGFTRFESLLKLLNLTNRMVYTLDELKSKPHLLEQLDYKEVNKILNREKERSLNWLRSALNAPNKESLFSFDYMVSKIYSENDRLKYELLAESNKTQQKIAAELQQIYTKLQQISAELDELRKNDKLQNYKLKLRIKKSKIKRDYAIYKILDSITFSKNKKINSKLSNCEDLYDDLEMMKRF